MNDIEMNSLKGFLSQKYTTYSWRYGASNACQSDLSPTAKSEHLTSSARERELKDSEQSPNSTPLFALLDPRLLHLFIILRIVLVYFEFAESVQVETCGQS